MESNQNNNYTNQPVAQPTNQPTNPAPYFEPGPQLQQTNNEPPKGTNKKIIVIIFLVVITLIVLAASLLLGSKKDTNTNTTTTPTALDPTSPQVVESRKQSAEDFLSALEKPSDDNALSYLILSDTFTKEVAKDDFKTTWSRVDRNSCRFNDSGTKPLMPIDSGRDTSHDLTFDCVDVEGYKVSITFKFDSQAQSSDKIVGYTQTLIGEKP